MNTSTKLFKLIFKRTNLKTDHVHSARAIQLGRVSRMSTATSVYKSQKKKDEFQDTFSKIIESIVKNNKYAEIPFVASWIKKVFEYNVVDGKRNRGLMTVFAYETLAKPEHVTEESKKLINILGWCVEMLQGYFLVIDDIMDGSQTRRGRPCWYRVPSVGLGAINDAILIYASMFELLNLHFGKLPQHVHLLTTFNECLLYTSSGQYLDYEMAKRNKNDYSLFTIENYNTIVKYKTAIYSITLPINLAAIMANITDQHLRKKMTDIGIEIGMFFQVQDDYIDCYSDESVSGKNGTDIQEGKCTWLAVQALQRCNSAQRAEFEANYGSQDAAKVDCIKRLYATLQLAKVYEEFERTQYEAIVRRAHALAPEVPPQLFLKIVDAFNKRTS